MGALGPDLASAASRWSPGRRGGAFLSDGPDPARGRSQREKRRFLRQRCGTRALERALQQRPGEIRLDFYKRHIRMEPRRREHGYGPSEANISSSSTMASGSEAIMKAAAERAEFHLEPLHRCRRDIDRGGRGGVRRRRARSPTGRWEIPGGEYALNSDRPQGADFGLGRVAQAIKRRRRCQRAS